MKNKAMRIKRPAFTPSAYRKLFSLAIIILLLSLPLSRRAQAAAGDLDQSFGSGGKAITDFAENGDFGNAVAIHSDGRIVLAGSTAVDGVDFTNFNFALARYNPNGSLDTSFGVGGKVTTDFGEGEESSAVAIQQDGKIIAAGTVTGDSASSIDFLVVRYNADGSLDPTFGSGGHVRTDFFNARDNLTGVALQSDGKIVAVGTTFSDFSGTAADYALARYNSDGSLDPTFGAGGKVTTDFLSTPGKTNLSDQALSVAISPNGKIVAAGNTDTSNGIRNIDISIARYNPDGSLDSTFDGDGKTTTDFNVSQDLAFDVLIQPDEKIIAAGNSLQDLPVGSNFALVRYLANGVLDTSFGSGGKVITDFSGRGDLIRGIALQSDGKIVAGGVSFLEFGPDIALAQYLTNGALDPSFGSGGKVITDITLADDTANDLAIQSDGKIVVAGYTFNAMTAYNFTVVRYNGSTTLDTCLQDDRVGNSLQINTTTGDYVFNNCDTGLTFSGRGVITIQGCVITLTHRTADRNLLARINTCQQQGNAVVSTFTPGLIGFSGINDSNTADNSCACR